MFLSREASQAAGRAPLGAPAPREVFERHWPSVPPLAAAAPAAPLSRRGWRCHRVDTKVQRQLAAGGVNLKASGNPMAAIAAAAAAVALVANVAIFEWHAERAGLCPHCVGMRLCPLCRGPLAECYCWGTDRQPCEHCGTLHDCWCTAFEVFFAGDDTLLEVALSLQGDPLGLWEPLGRLADEPCDLLRASTSGTHGSGSVCAIAAAIGDHLGPPVWHTPCMEHSVEAADAAATAALCATTNAANVYLAARTIEAAIGANNMGVQPADVGSAAVTSVAATPLAVTVAMGGESAGAGHAGVEPVLGAALPLEQSLPVRPPDRVDQTDPGFYANPPALALAPSPCGFPGDKGASLAYQLTGFLRGEEGRDDRAGPPGPTGGTSTPPREGPEGFPAFSLPDLCQPASEVLALLSAEEEAGVCVIDL